MHVVARWSLAVAVSAAAFALSWWICQEQVRLDEGAALGVAGAALALVLAVTGWWATRERPGWTSPATTGRRVIQKARGGRDVNIAGRDMTLIDHPRRDQ